MKTDPIRGTAVNKQTALTAQQGDETFYFCGDGCRRKFVANAGQATEPKACCCSKPTNTGRKSRLLRIFWPAVAIAAATTLLVGCSKPKKNAGNAGMPIPEVPVRNVAERPVPLRMEFTGQLTAAHQVEVRARVSGYVINVPFVEGSIVPAGALLFEIDPRPYIAKYEEAKAEASRAQATAALARQEFARAERLAQQDAIAKEEVERRKADLESATAALAAATARQAAAGLDVEFTRVEAPVTGRIGRALVKSGNLIAGGGAGATLLTTLVTVNPMHTLFHLDEPSYQQITALRAAGKGIAAEVRLSNGSTATGSIDYVSNMLDPRSGSAPARVLIENPNGEFAPGLFARVTLYAEGDKPRLLVPETAVGAEQGTRYVLVVDQENKLAHRRVILGERRGEERLVEDGLVAGERIVVNGLQRIRPGMTVRPIENRLASK
jgi:RND family efflux transporter MFP subunit